MKKYWPVFKNNWEEYFTYRFNFIMWRARMVLAILVVYFFWLAIFQNQEDQLFGYTQNLILTYILGSVFLRAIVFSSRTVNVGEEINQGNLTNFLLKPIGYFKYWFTRDLSDKLLNVIFAVFEIMALYLLLRPNIFLQTDISNLLLFTAGAFLALLLYFYINFLFGLVGFWTPETWAPRFVFFIFIEFFAGALFPLDILPKFLFNILNFLPFSYLLFFPLKIYLGQLNGPQITQGFLVAMFWILVFYKFSQAIWHKGLKVYAAEGR